MKRTFSGLGLVVLLSLGLGVAASGGWQQAEAQTAEVAWYRVVNEGRSAGTMNRWQRVGEGYAGTFPFLEDFEVDIRPRGPIIEAKVRDGRSRVTTAISCTSDRGPRQAMLRATRDGEGQAVIMVLIQCAATEPTVR